MNAPGTMVALGNLRELTATGAFTDACTKSELPSMPLLGTNRGRRKANRPVCR